MCLTTIHKAYYIEWTLIKHKFEGLTWHATCSASVFSLHLLGPPLGRDPRWYPGTRGCHSVWTLANWPKTGQLTRLKESSGIPKPNTWTHKRVLGNFVMDGSHRIYMFWIALPCNIVQCTECKDLLFPCSSVNAAQRTGLQRIAKLSWCKATMISTERPGAIWEQHPHQNWLQSSHAKVIVLLNQR